MYSYETEKSKLFTEEGQRFFISFRDGCRALLQQAGAVRLQEAIGACKVGAGESWLYLAAADRMVELGDLREVTGKDVPGQFRVFVGKGSFA